MRKLSTADRDNFERLLNIIKFTHNNKIENDKFLTIKVAVTEFKKQNGRLMSIEELQEFCKLEFDDFKFIDIFVQFLKDPETGYEAHNQTEDDQGRVRDYEKEHFKLETAYTSYISFEKLYKLYDILVNLHYFVPSDKTFSHSSFMKMLNPEQSSMVSPDKDTAK